MIKKRPFAPFPLWQQRRNFLTDSENAALLRYALDSESLFVPTTVVSSARERQDHGHRSSKKLSGSLGEWKPLLRQRFAHVFPEISKSVGLKEDTIDRIELEVVAHNHGDRFGRHLDTLYYGKGGPEKTTRFLSGVYYFFREPRRFTGGELRLYPFGSSPPPDQFAEVIPENKMAVFFPAFAAHEVLRVTCSSRLFADSRFAVNCWFHRSLK